MEIQLLSDIFRLFGISVGVLFVCSRLRIPTIVGFLVTGLVAGPHGLGFVAHTHAVEVMAEVGVVLLLFTIGLEFSIEQLLAIKKAVLLGGSLQVGLTIALAALLSHLGGLTWAQGVFTGCLLALSSTAIVLKLLQQRGSMDAPHGRAALGILIFQDIAVVPMMLVIPLLGGVGGDVTQSLFGLGKGLFIVAIVFIAARWGVPRLLHQIARSRDREFFLLSVVTICLLVAWAANQAGLSLSLGAFLAGLIISESEYSHHAIGNVLPFKDVFSTFFFVSIGMLLDLRIVVEQPMLVLGLTLGVLALKTIVGGLATMLLGYPLATMALTGLSLSQVGEFSFVLAKSGLDLGLIPQASYQLFLAVSVLTMALTPLMIGIGPHAVRAVSALPVPEKIKSGLAPEAERHACKNTNHLIIIGFGINGQNLARAARATNIPYDIIEINPDVVRRERKQGEPIWYGDATQLAVLNHVNAAHARAIVVAVSDPVATRRITKLARELNPKAFIIVRTRYTQELKSLYEAGASRVIPEEFETSIQIFSETLAEFGKSQQAIDEIVAQVRSNNYDLFRRLARHDQGLFSRIEKILT